MVSGVSTSRRILVTDPTAPTILLIDDNNKDRTYYADRIRISLPDCLVLEAKDGNSGLQLYQSRRIDCIVTELYLPDMSGMELLLDLVPRASFPEPAVIVLAHVGSKALADMVKAKGAQAFLVKRSTAGDELVSVIQKSMDTVRTTRKDRRE